MADSDFSANELRNQFENMIRDILPSKLVSNFISVAEVANSETSELSVSVSDGMTPWLADGMLKYASDMIASGELNDD